MWHAARTIFQVSTKLGAAGGTVSYIPKFTSVGTANSIIVQSATGIFVSGTGRAIVPAPAATGTPAQHGLYQINVPKFFARFNATGVVASSFNVTAVTNPGAGLYKIAFTRSFASAGYCVIGMSDTQRHVFANASMILVSAVTIQTRNDSGTLSSPAGHVSVMGFGRQ